MSKLMDELMAEITRVNNLEVEVKRTVEMHNTEIKASRDKRMMRPVNFIGKMGLTLAKLGANYGSRGYYPQIPLDICINGKPLYVNYSIEWADDKTKAHLSVYGGFANQIQYRIYSKGIFPDYSDQTYVVDALIDMWDDECEAKFEYRIEQIIKKSLASKTEAMQKKLEKSNNEYEQYFTHVKIMETEG